MRTFGQVAKVAVSVVLAATMVMISSGCARSNEEDSGNSTSGVADAVQVSDTAFSEAYLALRNAKLGDKISGTTYLVSVANGMKTYYIHGRYVLVSADTNTVVQLRDEIEVPNTSLSIREIIGTDKEFDIGKATVSFFSADNTQVSGTLDDTVTATITDCVVEYADWEDETETFGIVQSYLFTYGYVPVKITGYYEASDNSSATSGDTSTVTSESDNSSGDGAANTSESTSGAGDTTSDMEQSSDSSNETATS